MDKIQSFQASIFGSFANIKPDSLTIRNLLKTFNNFFPSSVTMINIDSNSNNLKYENRLQLVSNDHSFLITFLIERIDINYLIQQNKESSLEEINKELNKIIMDLSKVFPDIKGNRLTNGCKLQSNDFSSSSISSFINKNSNPSLFFKNEMIINEWGQRYNSQYKEIINNHEELTNHIITLERTLNSDKISMTIDINTVPNDQNLIFSFTDLMKFTELCSTEIRNYIDLFNKNGN